MHHNRGYGTRNVEVDTLPIFINEKSEAIVQPQRPKCRRQMGNFEGKIDEVTTSTSTPAAPSPTPAPAAPSSAPPSGPITGARAREFNFVMMLKNEGPKD
jgi:hypothetical protein